MSSLSHSTLVSAFVLLAVACRPPDSPVRGESEQGESNDALQALVEGQELSPFGPGDSGNVGLAPERIARRGSGDYSLLYVLSEDGSSIETRFRGPSGAVSAGLRVAPRNDGEVFRLVATMPGCEELATLAAWRRDEAGGVTDAHVRLTPVVEVRVSELKAGQFVGDRQWRPLRRGEPVGAWRP